MITATVSPLPSAFRNPKGEARFMAAYQATMELWPVPYESIDITGHFGRTHLAVSGPETAPPLILVHGDMLSLTMWSPNIAELSRDHRVYAVDVMGQPSKSIPDQPMRNRADCATWFSGVLDALGIPKATFVGMSYGACLSLNYAISTPARVEKLILLSPGGSFLKPTPQFYLRFLPSMLFSFLPKSLFDRAFWRYCTGADNLSDDAQTRELDHRMLDQVYLGVRYIRKKWFLQNITQSNPLVLSDEELREVSVPTLLLIGEDEVIFDPTRALERAIRLIPDIEGDLIPQASHGMTVGQHKIVNERFSRFICESARQGIELAEGSAVLHPGGTVARTPL